MWTEVWNIRLSRNIPEGKKVGIAEGKEHTEENRNTCICKTSGKKGTMEAKEVQKKKKLLQAPGKKLRSKKKYKDIEKMKMDGSEKKKKSKSDKYRDIERRV